MLRRVLRPVLRPVCGCLPVAVLAVACSSAPSVEPAPSAHGVRVVTSEAVAHCTALPTVVGSHAQPAMQNGMLAAQSFGSARTVAINKAQAEGATHLVWGDEIVGAAGSFITARPYRCERIAKN